MTEKDDDKTVRQGEGRRGALKKLLAGGGVVVGSSALPSEWTKPVIESIVLPAHAGVSGPVTTATPPPITTPGPTSTGAEGP